MSWIVKAWWSYPFFEFRYLVTAWCASYPLLGLFAIYVLIERGHDRWPKVFFLPYHIYGGIFWLLDVIYNIAVGTIVFFDLPREKLFTARLERYVATGYQPEWCDRFIRNLDALDEGHVKGWHT